MREKYKELKSKLRIRRITLLMALLLGVILTYCTSDENKDISELQKDIAGKIIRFHVLANSDSDEDQALKLKVKENVVKYITPLLENSEDINETRKILNEIRQEIINIAEETIKNEGYEYEVTAKITYCYFPTKAYGDVVLPPGEYEAFEIEIGEARGKNWWCILYPPLCFVDVTHGVVPDSSKQMLKNVLDEDEYEAVTNVEDNVGYRFKVLEWLGFYD